MNPHRNALGCFALGLAMAGAVAVVVLVAGNTPAWQFLVGLVGISLLVGILMDLGGYPHKGRR